MESNDQPPNDELQHRQSSDDRDGTDNISTEEEQRQQCCFCWIHGRSDDSIFVKPSNETLLCVAFVSFMGFTSVQSVVAFVAKSEAMMGDSAAMAVDALTYGFNLYAERQKSQAVDESVVSEDGGIELTSNNPNGASLQMITRNDSDDSTERIQQKLQLYRRRRHLHLELIPPLMSVSILIVVIGFVLHKAIHILVLDSHRSKSEQSRPNLILMMTFSCLNLLLDLVNVTCFARAKHLMGYNTIDVHVESVKSTRQQYGKINHGGGVRSDYSDYLQPAGLGGNGETEESNEDEMAEDNNKEERVNLNMCSAYTVSYWICIG
eukprot:g12152.t1.1.5e17418b g12152  g12152.t1 contig6:1326968-1328043(+)